MSSPARLWRRLVVHEGDRVGALALTLAFLLLPLAGVLTCVLAHPSRGAQALVAATGGLGLLALLMAMATMFGDLVREEP